VAKTTSMGHSLLDNSSCSASQQIPSFMKN